MPNSGSRRLPRENRDQRRKGADSCKVSDDELRVSESSRQYVKVSESIGDTVRYFPIHPSIHPEPYRSQRPQHRWSRFSRGSLREPVLGTPRGHPHWASPFFLGIPLYLGVPLCSGVPLYFSRLLCTCLLCLLCTWVSPYFRVSPFT